MRISDYQRRRILHLIKHFKSAHKHQAALLSRHSWSNNGIGQQGSPPAGRLSTARAASMPDPSMLGPGSPKPPVSVSPP